VKHIPLVNLGSFLKDKELDIQTGPFGTQLKASDYSSHGTPVINVRNIGFRSEKIADLEYLNEAHSYRLRQHRLEKNDIAFGRKGAVDRHLIIKEKQNAWIQGSDCIRIRIKSKLIDPDFLSFFFLTGGHRSWMEIQGSFGATMGSLNQGIIERISFPLFPLPIQRKIAAVLSAYDDLIENNTRRIAILEKMAEELYREWFVRLRFPGHEKTKIVKGVPEGWATARLSEVCDLISRGISPKYDDNSPYFVINQKCIRNAKVDLSEARRHSTKVPREKMLKYGDVLINSTGVGTLGRVSAIEFEVAEITCDSHVSICRVKIEKATIHYLAFCLKGLQSHFESSSVGATGQTELNRTEIARTMILLPTLPLQDAFSKTISPIWALKRLLDLSLQNLTTTRDRLLFRLMSGKIDLESLDIQFPPSMREDVGRAHG
jgi:type I restriction enzyme, S subunit